MARSAWLENILDSRGLPRPDGRMLYQYRLTQDEFQLLHAELHRYAGFGLDDVYHSNDFPQLFVMYAAEWWRRKYQGGAWRWISIIEDFGCNPDYFSANNRSDAVIRGLAYWGHRPSGEGKIYFGAMVAQGGLPLAFIGQGGGKLALIMAYTLRLAAQYEWDESSVIQSVKEQAEILPDSIRRQEIYDLIAKMVLAVLELRQEFDLAGAIDPLARLAERDPKWQERFPLPLEDAAAQKLLSGLVREASRNIAPAHSGVFTVERYLRKADDGRYQLLSSLGCPSSASLESLTALFGLSSDRDLPRYFSIDVQVHEREPFADARQILGVETASVSLAGRKRTWQSRSACAEHCLFIRATSGDLRSSPLSIPGGQEIAVSEPWVFVDRNNKIELTAVGSARVPEGEALIMVPPGWKVVPADSTTLVKQSSCIELDDESLSLVTVCGDVTLEDGESRYRVRTHQPTGAEDSYAWEGKRVAYPSKPNAVYIGVPKLFRYTADGERNRVSSAQLDWFIAGTSTRIVDANFARGPVDVFVIRDGERLTRFRFVVLDIAVRIDFLSGKSPSDGAICFDGWSAADISMTSQVGLAAVIEKTGESVNLRLHVGNVPPESIQVSMHWLHSPVELALRLPFPSSGGRFFDGIGRVLRDTDSLTLCNLIGARLRIFDRNPQAPKRYDLELNITS